MKKKKILIATILIVILVVILILILLQQKQTNKIDDVEETAKARYTTTIGETEYGIDNLIESNPVPSMSAGMIPVKINGEKWVITTKDDNNWYDYANGKVAYMMLSDGTYQSELAPNMTGKKLAKDYVGKEINTTTDTLGTIYVWVPRFAYNESGEIVYIKQGCNVAGSYTLPEIFTYKISNEDLPDLSLAGIWVEYNPLANSSAVNTKVSDMQGENNKYGLIANAIGVNANNEETYKETITKFVGVHTCEVDTTNLNRTILKVTNTNKVEPIKAKAEFNESTFKISIDVIYRTNSIVKILSEDGTELELKNNSTKAVDTNISGNGTYVYIIIDNLGNAKKIDLKITGLTQYIIPNLKILKKFRDEVNSGTNFNGITVIQTADIDVNEGKYTIDEKTKEITFSDDAEEWIPIGDNTTPYQYKFSGTYDGGRTLYKWNIYRYD